MNYILNKKLLEIILDKSIHSFSYCKEFKEMTNFISITFKDGTTTAINIYELAHKCKELAWRHGYNILIDCYNKELTEFEAYVIQDNISNDDKWVNNSHILYHIEAKTEPEAIFKACEWIFKRKEIL